MFYWKVILTIFLLPFVEPLSNSEIKSFFGDKNCIVGSLHTLHENSVLEITSQNIGPSNDFVESMLGPTNDAKSATSALNELAQYNDISYSYELVKEEGPPHSKIFTVTLYLGDEQYTEEEKSIKKAQREAASTALKNTRYEHPPIRIKENAKALTPTVLLNNLAAKLGLAVTYTVVNNDILEELENHNDALEFHPKKSYLQKLNETIHSNDTIRVRKDGSDPKGPFKVRVDVNGNKFIGEAHTIKNAKHEAALKALKALKENEDSFHCLKEGDNCMSNKKSIKSPISLVYESAQKRNLGVIFEIIDEVGPSHKKLFTTKCTIGHLEATGQGKSKKESKRAAAENILPQLSEIPETKGARQNIASNSKKSKKKNKKNKVIKTTFDKVDRMLDNVVDFGKSLIDKIKGNEVNDNDDLKPPKSKNSKNNRSPADEIMQLGKILELQIQYNDFEENDKTYSVLDLGTKPAVICLGEGVNKKNSRDLAAKHGIDVLYKLGLLDNLLDKTMKIRYPLSNFQLSNLDVHFCKSQISINVSRLQEIRSENTVQSIIDQIKTLNCVASNRQNRKMSETLISKIENCITRFWNI